MVDATLLSDSKVTTFLTKITAALSYHRVRGLYLLAVIFVTSIHILTSAYDRFYCNAAGSGNHIRRPPHREQPSLPLYQHSIAKIIQRKLKAWTSFNSL